MFKLRSRLFSSVVLVGVPLALMGPALGADQTADGAQAPAAADQVPAPEKDKTAAPAENGKLQNGGAYIDENRKSALGVSGLQTPMSDENFNQNFQKSTASNVVEDSYKYTNSLRSAGTTGYDMNLRGFTTQASDRGAILTDGLPGASVRFGSVPNVALDHMEVIKGPASVLFGAGQPGGFVNLVTKQPDDYFHGDVNFSGQGYANSKHSLGERGSFDITGPFDDAKTLLGRTIGEEVYRKTFHDHGYDHQTYISQAFIYRPVVDSELHARIEHREAQSDDYIGLVAPQNNIKLVTRNLATSYQNPNDKINESGTATNVGTSHTFNNNMKFTFDVRDVEHVDHSKGYENNHVFSDYQTLGRLLSDKRNQRQYDFANMTLQIPFNTWDVGHNVVVGAGGGRESLWTQRFQYLQGDNSTLSSLNISIYDPYNGKYNYGSAYSDTALYPLCGAGKAGTVNGTSCNKNLINQTTVSMTGAGRVSDMISLADQWKVLLAGRYDRDIQNFSQRSDYPIAGATSYSVNHYDVGQFLPMMSLIYEPIKDKLSIYSTYSTGFVPQNGNNNNIHGGLLIEPAKARSEEIGSKASFFDGALVATAALFSIQKEHTPVNVTCATDAPAGIACYALSTTHSRGVELQADNRITKAWHVITGYALVDARITSSGDPLSDGARATNTPRNSAHLWSRYDFQQERLKGWGFGIGEALVGWRAGTVPTTPTACTATNGDACYSNRVLHLPGYATTDLAVYYNLPEVKWTLKVGNIFNTRYYASANASSNLKIISGDPFNVTLSTSIPF